MATTLTYGLVAPDNGDFGSVWFPAVRANFVQIDAHNHDGANSAQLSNSSLLPNAAIARTKIAAGTVGKVLYNDGATGLINEETTLATSRGGLNIASYTTGDILYASSSSILSKLGIGSTNQTLVVAAGIPSWTTLPIAGGGTGATSKAAAFDALQPMTTSGDIIYGGASGTGTRLPKGSDNQFLKLASGIPAWSNLSTSNPTIQKFTSTGTTAGYVFYITSASATVGATYTNNANTYTVINTIASGTILFCSGTGAPAASGNLVKTSGTGSDPIAFSTSQAYATYTLPSGPTPIYIRIVGVGGGAGGAAAATNAGASGGNSWFGANLIMVGGGNAGLVGNSQGGAGGTNTIGAGPTGISIGGSAGGQGAASTTPAGANGGTSAFGGAGAGGAAGTNPGLAAATNSGSGGGGANGGSNASGGGGAGGFVDLIITSPSATYPYAVGLGGAGGAAGTQAGGAGAAGQLVIYEHYQ